MKQKLLTLSALLALIIAGAGCDSSMHTLKKNLHQQHMTFNGQVPAPQMNHISR